MHEACLLREADESPSGIKESDQEEDDNDRPHGRIRQDRSHMRHADAEGRCERRRHGDDAVRRCDDACHKAGERGDDDAIENGAGDFSRHQERGHKGTEDGEPGGRYLEGADGNDGRRICNDDAAALQANKGNEDTDAGCHRIFQILRDRINDDLTDPENGNDSEQDGSDEDPCHRLLPWHTHGKDDGVGEESIVTKPRRDGDRIVRKESHEEASQNRRKCGSREDRPRVHPGIPQDLGIHK